MGVYSCPNRCIFSISTFIMIISLLCVSWFDCASNVTRSIRQLIDARLTHCSTFIVVIACRMQECGCHMQGNWFGKGPCSLRTTASAIRSSNWSRNPVFRKRSPWKKTVICRHWGIQPFWLARMIWPHCHIYMSRMCCITWKFGMLATCQRILFRGLMNY